MAPNSSSKDAEILLKIIRYFTNLEDDNYAITATSSLEQLSEWWSKATSTRVPAKPVAKKWLELLNDQEWRVAMETYVSTRVGYKSWSIGVANMMQKHQYSEFWLGLFNETNEFFEKVFTPDTKNLVRDIDLKTLCVLPSPRTNEGLRHLFFPKDEEYYININPRKLDFISKNLVLFADVMVRQEMKKVLSINRLTFTHRRAGFLQDLSDKQYLEVFGVLTSEEGADLRVWTWEALERQVKDVSVIAENLFNHIMFWYDPLYAPPKRTKAVKEAKEDEEPAEVFSWIDTLRSKFFKTGNIDRDEGATNKDAEDTPGSDEDAEHALDSDKEVEADPVIDFIDEIFQVVEEHFGVWSSAEFTTMLHFVPILCYAVGDQPKRLLLQHQYLQRFQHEHWVAILKICERCLPGTFNGIAENAKKAIDKGDLPKPWAKWTTFSDGAFAQGFWNEQEKKNVCLNGLQVSFESYIELTGDKFVYAQRKEELQKMLKYPGDDDAELLTSLTTDITKCAYFLGDHGIEVDPLDPDEDVAELVVGRMRNWGAGSVKVFDEGPGDSPKPVESQKRKKRASTEDLVSESEEDVETSAGEKVDERLGDSPKSVQPQSKKRAFVDEGLGDSPKSEESQDEQGRKRVKLDEWVNVNGEEAAAGQGEVAHEGLGDPQKLNGKGAGKKAVAKASEKKKPRKTTKKKFLWKI